MCPKALKIADNKYLKSRMYTIAKYIMFYNIICNCTNNYPTFIDNSFLHKFRVISHRQEITVSYELGFGM